MDNSYVEEALETAERAFQDTRGHIPVECKMKRRHEREMAMLG
ncbi:hypothetical protein [Halovenus sp. HT40]